MDWVWRAREGSTGTRGGEPTGVEGYVGVEYAGMRLTPLARRSFSHVEFVYLPLRGMGASLLAHNVGACVAARSGRGEPPPARVLVDWPSDFAPYVETILAVHPSGMALAPASYVGMGSLAGVQGEEDLSRVWLVEALNPRRVLITRLRALFPGLKVECVGGYDGNVAALVHEDLDLAEGPLPQEHLLPFGLLPFLAGRAEVFRKSLSFSPDVARIARAHAASMAANAHEAEDSGVKTLAIIDELGLTFLPELLDALETEAGLTDPVQEAGANAGVVSLARARARADIRTARDSGAAPEPLAAARPAPEHHAQYAGCNGFQSRHLWTLFAEGTPVSTSPLRAQADSLAASFAAAASRFAEWTRQDVSAHERTNVFRFLHRLARARGRLFPDQFDMLLAAQSVVNSNLSYEWLRECRDFPLPPKGVEAALPELHLPLAAFTPRVSTLSIERFDTIQRHRPRARLRSMASGPGRRETSHEPVDESKHADNAWVHGDHPYSCSFPDEDVFMEEFAFALRRQAAEKVRGLETRVHEMTTSLEDGLDLRQTIRGWNAGKIFVREEVNLAKADIGAIMFRFDSHGAHAGQGGLDSEETYPWRAFWQAEAHDASHLLFYATPFQDNLIGPGIAKSEFGGFAVLPLTSAAFDPWHDPYVRALCRTPAEALLLASALGTREKCVLYVAPEPPPHAIATLIKRSGKSIVYQRLDDCPPDKIRRLRTFHILAEAGVRAYAQKYIRKED